MRRQTPDLRRTDELLGPQARQAASVDPRTMIELCESMVTDERKARIQEVIARRLRSVVVVLDGPHDPHNGAAVIRTCDAFSIQNLHIIERYEPFLVAPSVAKGSEQWVDVHTHESTEDMLSSLVASEAASEMASEPTPFEFVATAADGELLPGDLRDIPRLALVVGNEREGIAPDLRRHCRRAVRVPMSGFIDSLNLSVSTAILLYAATLGRTGDLPAEERLRLYARGLYLTVPRAAEVLLAARRHP